MENPAADLVVIFEGWESSASDKSLGVSRGMKGSTEAALQHVVAMRLIDQILHRLTVLEAEGIAVDVFREASVKWVHLVVGYPHGWSTAGATVNLSQEARLDMLRALVIVLASRPSNINVSALSELGEFLDGIQTLLGEDEGLDDALRAYIARLVAEVRRAFDMFRSTGIFDAEESARNLWVALLAAQAQSKGRKGAWTSFADKIKAPVATGLIVGLPMLAIEAAKIAAGG